VVVIDCPPLKPVSDSLIISRYASAVLYVVKSDGTPHQLVSAAIKRLHDIDAPLLGVVLNLVDFTKADRYGHYSYGYKYQYAMDKSPASRPEVSWYQDLAIQTGMECLRSKSVLWVSGAFLLFVIFRQLVSGLPICFPGMPETKCTPGQPVRLLPMLPRWRVWRTRLAWRD